MPPETITKDGDGEEKINEDYEDRRGSISAHSTHTLMSALSLYAPKPVILRLLRASQRNDLSG